MSQPLSIQALGHRFEVDVDSLTPAQVAGLRAQWARCAPGAQDPVPPADPPTLELPAIEDPVRRDYQLSSSLTFSAIRQAAGSGVMLHACGVAAPATGQVAVLVAASGTGKTTAAARLCARDFGYVTDETVLIRPDRTVLPYPKPLSVVLPGDDPHHKQQHGPDELRLRQPPARLHADALVLLDRVGRDGRDDAARAPQRVPSLEPVGLIDALMTLIPHTSSLTALDRPLATLAGLIEDLGGVHTLYYREIEQTAELIDLLLQQRRTAPRADSPGFRAIPLPVPTAPRDLTDWIYAVSADESPVEVPAAQQLGPDWLVLRAPFDDAISADGEVVVLGGSVPTRLSGLGSTIWLAAQDPVPVRRLVRICRAEHGDHPQAEHLVRAAVADLLGAGTLLAREVGDRVPA